jgi:hypothetical protein
LQVYWSLDKLIKLSESNKLIYYLIIIKNLFNQKKYLVMVIIGISYKKDKINSSY